jgi:hypothetical protein
MVTGRQRSARWAWLFCLVLLSGAACREAAEPSDPRPARRAWPSGAVLALNDVPIFPEEVDAVGSDYALLEPQDTPLQLRRLALANTILPVIAAQGMEPERRGRALELAESYRKALLAGGMPSGPLAGPMESERSGRFSELGFALWRTALQAEPGSWSEILETAGCFHLVRVKSREEGSLPSLTRFTIGVFDFPYLDSETAGAEINAALDRSRLTIIDEAWRDAVPAALRYRLHAENT